MHGSPPPAEERVPDIVRFDALMPPEMAAKAAEIGVVKAHAAFVPTFVLAVLAGAFIAIGAAFATTVIAGTAGVPYGFVRLAAGVAFSLGLVLVLVGGAELFTGNNLLAFAWASRRISTFAVLRNWVIVYLGNLVGSVATVIDVTQVASCSIEIGLTGLPSWPVSCWESPAREMNAPSSFSPCLAQYSALVTPLRGMAWASARPVRSAPEELTAAASGVQRAVGRLVAAPGSNTAISPLAARAPAVVS